MIFESIFVLFSFLLSFSSYILIKSIEKIYKSGLFVHVDVNDGLENENLQNINFLYSFLSSYQPYFKE